MDAPAADPVLSVLATWGARRDARLVRRFDHGVGGTSLITLDGSPVVLKAWPMADGNPSHLEAALVLAEVLRGRGVPVPTVIERGTEGGYDYLVYELLDGEWSDRLGPEAIQDLLQIVEMARDAAPEPNPAWGTELHGMLTRGDPSFDIDPGALLPSAPAVRVLEEARRRLEACPPSELRTGDIVHGDFAPENLLMRDARVVGVVDWERARVGDSGMDLVGAIFDVEIGEKAPTVLRDQLWSAARELLPAAVLAAYVGVYAVRYLSWSVGTDMEAQVLDLADQLLERSDAGPSLRSS